MKYHTIMITVRYEHDEPDARVSTVSFLYFIVL